MLEKGTTDDHYNSNEITAMSLTYMDIPAEYNLLRNVWSLTHWGLWPLLLTWFNFNPGMDK